MGARMMSVCPGFFLPAAYNPDVYKRQAYYNTVAAVLRKAVQRPLTKEDLRTVIERCAFSESVLSIEPALTSEKWQLLRPDGTTPLLHRCV